MIREIRNSSDKIPMVREAVVAYARGAECL